MKQAIYSSAGWESWGLEFKPVIPEGMSLIFDEDLLFEDDRGLRPSAVVNRWACELPTSKVPSDNSWPSYVRAVREWMEFGDEYGVGLFEDRDRLKALLSAYAVHRARGSLKARFKASTWNQHMAMLGKFYSWAINNGYTTALPFTYDHATGLFEGQLREAKVNQARRRQAKEHVTIKYLEDDFADLFLKGLARLEPDGTEERGYRGREMARNSAVGRFLFASGPRKQEFTYLPACEVPALPKRRTEIPSLVPLPWGITKGGKFRNTWVDYDSLVGLHNYLAFERATAVAGSAWMPPARWGEPLIVTEPDGRGGRVNGVRMQWEDLGPGERRRLVAPGGGSMLLSVCGPGRPFTAWNTVFERASDRIRERYEPRFPHVHPHRGRHTFAMQTMTKLASGYYARLAQKVQPGDTDAALALYLTRHEPLLILRDLLGHSSALTTEKYLARPGGAQAEFLADVAEEEQVRNQNLTLAAFRDSQKGIMPSGPGARDLIEFFVSVDEELQQMETSAPGIKPGDQEVINLLARRAKTLHLGIANYCWFIDPSKALCLILAGTPGADKPLAGMCDSARCPQATHHLSHRPIWADSAENKKVFIGSIRRGQPTEKARLQSDLDRDLRVLAEIDAASERVA